MFFENDDKSYTIIDLYLNNRCFGYKDSYNYYDIDVDKISLFKKSNNEYIIRYNDVNKMTVVPFLVPSLVQLINTHKYTH